MILALLNIQIMQELLILALFGDGIMRELGTLRTKIGVRMRSFLCEDDNKVFFPNFWGFLC